MRRENSAAVRRCKHSLAADIRRRVKRFLSAAVSASVIACSMPAVPVRAAAYDGDADVQEFTLTVNDLCDAVEKALREDEPISESAYTFEGDAQEAYEELFYGTDVYEIEPETGKDGGNDLRLKVFVRPGDGRELDSSEITGEEEIIFLLLNNSGEEAAARIIIDEYDTGLITVAPRGAVTAVDVEEEISTVALSVSDGGSEAEDEGSEAAGEYAEEGDESEAAEDNEGGSTGAEDYEAEDETDDVDSAEASDDKDASEASDNTGSSEVSDDEDPAGTSDDDVSASDEPADQKTDETGDNDPAGSESEKTGEESENTGDDKEADKGNDPEAGKGSGDDDKDAVKTDSANKDDKTDGNGASAESARSSHRSNPLRASLDYADDADDETTPEAEEADDEVVIAMEEGDDDIIIVANDSADEAVTDDSEVIIDIGEDDEPAAEETVEAAKIHPASASNALTAADDRTLIDGETYEPVVVNHSRSGVGYVTTLRNLGIDYGIRLLADGPEAKIGEDIYETLALAVDAAEEGDTITLINNVTVAGTSTYAKIKKSITIDMAGFNINVTAGNNNVFELTAGGITFVLTNSEKDGGIIDGKPDGTETASGKVAVYSSSNAVNVSLSNIIIQNFSTTPIYLLGSTMSTDSSFELNNCIIRNNVSTGYAGALRLHFFDSVVIKNSEISGNEAVMAGGGMYILNCSDIDIEGNIFNGNIANTPQSGNDYYGGGAFCLVSPGRDITVKDNKITDNTAEYLGGGFTIYSVKNITYEMGDVLIEGNTVTGNHVINGVRNLITAQGGGIAVIDENTSHSKPVYVTFSDNEISKNIAGTDGKNSSYNRGGGIALAGFSDDINFYIVSGEITDNTAAWGGGIDYTFKESSTLYLYNTVITENEAVRGGGVWLCPTSITDMSTTFGGAIYGNSAGGGFLVSDGGYIDSSGDDICYESKDSTIIQYLINPWDNPDKDPQFLSSKATVIAEALGGHMIDWYEDGDGEQHRYTDEYKMVDVARDYKDRRTSFGLHAELDQQGQYFAEACAEVVISGNTATMFGGGIASNARMYFGDEYETYPVRDITVTKSWLDTEGKELSSAETESYSVDISLVQTVEDLGLRNKLMTVNFSKDNNWTYEFKNLATKYIDQNLEVHDCDYTVEESNISADGNCETEIIPGDVRVTDDEGNSEQIITVINTLWVNPTPSLGDLTISKTVTGTGGSVGQEFTFTVTLSDTSINGTYGDLTFVNGIATFTLKDGESKTAAGLPAGTEYTVTEAPVSGYTTTSEAASGMIVAGSTINVTYINDWPSTTTTTDTDGGGRHSGGGSGGSGRSGGSTAAGPGAGEGGPEEESTLWALLPMPETGQGREMLFGVCALALSAMALIVLLRLRRERI